MTDSFTRQNKMFRRYAIAGTLHLKHLAELADCRAQESILKRNGVLLSQSLGSQLVMTEVQMARMLRAHAEEWIAFIRSLGSASFVAQWARTAT